MANNVFLYLNYSFKFFAQKIHFISILLPFILLICYSCTKQDNIASQIENGLLPAAMTPEMQGTGYTLEERMNKYNIPAVSIAIIHNMEIRWAEARGVKKAGESEKVSTTTLFQAASISKPVAATGAVKLAQDGIVSLHQDISTFLTNWTIPRDNYEEKVTIERILSHSAGLGVGGFAGYESETSLPTLNDILDGTPPANSPPVRLRTAPGKRFSYSGGGYMIMQKILEEVTGKSFPMIMEENVFGPLEMENSHYAPLSDELKKQAAWGHVSGPEPIPNYGPIHVESAAGGLWSTPTDLALLLIDLMKAYNGKSASLFSPDTLKMMMEPRYWDYGLGFKVVGEGKSFRFSHGGATTGWHSHFIAFPERGQGVVIMTNGTNGWVLWPEIERAVSAALDWPIIKPKMVERYAYAEEELEKYSGDYTLGGGFNIELTTGTSDLILQFEDLRWNLIPVSQDTFEIREMEGQVFFRRENKEISGLHIWFGEPDWSPYREWDFEKVEE